MPLLWVTLLSLSAFGQQNPLLQVADLPAGTPPPFEQIRPEHVAPAIEELIAREKAAAERLKSSPGPRTWANTMEPLEELGEPLARAFGVIRILESVRSTRWS